MIEWLVVGEVLVVVVVGEERKKATRAGQTRAASDVQRCFSFANFSSSPK